MIEKHSTGAATLLIHILAKAATNMFVTKTVRGRVPALLRTQVAIRFAMSYLESAAATVKPPRSSIITGDHMAGKMNFAASEADNLLSEPTVEGKTLRITHRNGTIKDVTKRGMT